MDANFFERLAQETLKRTTGSILIDAGFHQAKPGALNILSDILKKYLEKLYKTTVNFAQHADHNSVLIEDALAALKKLNISPETIVDYMEKQKPKPLPNPTEINKKTKYWSCLICSDVWEEGKNMVECDMWNVLTIKKIRLQTHGFVRTVHRSIKHFFAQFDDV